MRSSRDTKAIWIIGLALSIALLQIHIGFAEDLEEARRYVRGIYRGLREAELRGADVQEAASRLDEALDLLRKAEETGDSSEREKSISKAISIAGEVEASIERLVKEGEAKNRWRTITLSSSAALVALGSILTYLYTPRIFWGLWLRARRGWRVKRA